MVFEWLKWKILKFDSCCFEKLLLPWLSELMHCKYTTTWFMFNMIIILFLLGCPTKSLVWLCKYGWHFFYKTSNKNKLHRKTPNITILSYNDLRIWVLTLYLLVSSVDNLCKHFGPWSGPTKCRACSGSKLLDTRMVFLNELFEKVDFEQNQQTTISMQYYPVGKELNHICWKKNCPWKLMDARLSTQKTVALQSNKGIVRKKHY